MADAPKCPNTPQAFSTLLTLPHAYLSLRVQTDATGAPMMPIYDEAALKAKGLDVSLFLGDPDAVACLTAMVKGNTALTGSLDRALAAAHYFTEGGNTDKNPPIISWGELAAGYSGKNPQELRNAVINIQSAVGLIQKVRTMMPAAPAPAAAGAPAAVAISPASGAAPSTGPAAAAPAAGAADAPSAADLRAAPSGTP